MRVYLHGKCIPMSEVTWDILCCTATLVTYQDPEIGFPQEILDERINAIERCRKALGIETWLDKAISFFGKLMKHSEEQVVA